jgi:hypothetical protein
VGKRPEKPKPPPAQRTKTARAKPTPTPTALPPEAAPDPDPYAQAAAALLDAAARGSIRAALAIAGGVHEKLLSRSRTKPPENHRTDPTARWALWHAQRAAAEGRDPEAVQTVECPSCRRHFGVSIESGFRLRETAED